MRVRCATIDSTMSTTDMMTNHLFGGCVSMRTGIMSPPVSDGFQKNSARGAGCLWRLLAAEIAGNLPAACVLQVAHLIGIERYDGDHRNIADLSRRRDDAHHRRRLAGLHLFRHDANEIQAKLVDHGSTRLRAVAHFKAGFQRK